MHFRLRSAVPFLFLLVVALSVPLTLSLVGQRQEIRQHAQAAAPAGVPGSWALDFSDDFNGTSLDTNKWAPHRYGSYNGGDAPWNPGGEDAWYNSANVSVQNGNLLLTTQDQSKNIEGKTYPISSGVVQSGQHYAFKPGYYIEASIYVPNCDGCWPAFWTLSTPPEGSPGYQWPPEFDIFEFFGTQSDAKPQFNYHYPPDGQTGPKPYGDASDYRNGYHTYGMYWNGSKATPYVDGKAYDNATATTNMTQKEQYIILNLAVQAGHHPPAGSQMKVDWVRVWRPSSAAQTQISPSYYVTPTLYCLGSCPSEPPSITQAPSGAPSEAISINPSTAPSALPSTTSANPLNPCQIGSPGLNLSKRQLKHVKKRLGKISRYLVRIEKAKHEHKEGAIQRLVRRILKQFSRILKEISGGKISLDQLPPLSGNPCISITPSPSLEPSPSTGQEPSTSPGVSTVPSSGPTTAITAQPTLPPSNGTVINVKNAEELKAALLAVKPGQTIQMAPGTYQGNFVAAVPGTAAAPITLKGPRGAILNGGNTGSGYVLHLQGANYYNVDGFTITNGQKGLMLDNTNHATITGLDINNIGQEGLHLRTNSSDNSVRNNTVHDTGKKTAAYGEGIYLGSANSNWGTYTNGQPDKSDRNIVIGNNLYNNTAENIDIKEGTTGGIIQDNIMNGSGLSGDNFADSWVDVKGNNYTIKNNTGTNSILDGFQVHQVLSGWGNNTVFHGNRATVNSSGYGFNIDKKATGTVVGCDNVVTGAAAGMSNIPCSN